MTADWCVIMVVQGLAGELNREGACDQAIYPDENIAITSCDIAGYYEEGVGDHSPFALQLCSSCVRSLTSAPVLN